MVSSIVERAGNKSRTNKNNSNSNSNGNGRRSSYGRVAGDEHEHDDDDDEDDDENFQLVEEGMIQHHGVVEDYNQRFTIDDEDYED